LDLVGANNQNLADGGSGGTLTAGNTDIVGQLNVRGATSLTQGLAVGDALSVKGAALFQNNTDSTTALQIQNSAGTSNLLVADTTNTRIGIGTNAPQASLHVSATGSGGDLFRITDTTATSQDVVKVANGGATTFRNQTDSTTAFLIQTASGPTTLFAADTTNLVITIAGNTTTFGSLTLTNAHLKTTQTNPPTIGSGTNCGTTPSLSITAGSTDTAGSFDIITDSGGTLGACSVVITFNKSYGSAPKSIMISPKSTNASGKPMFPSGAASGNFTATMVGTAAGSTSYSYYYFVIE
jgi:hypothetical protein